jgi:AraC-like DNA-binding protein
MPTDPPRIREGFEGERLVVVPQAIAQKCESLPVVQNLFATDIGHFPTAQHHFVERPSGASETIFIYCIEGRGWCKLNERTYDVEEGNALFIPANTPHVYGADQDAPWSICWAHVKGQNVSSYLDALGVTPTSPTLHVPDTGLVVEAFEEVYAHVHHGFSDDRLLGISTALSRLFGALKTSERASDDRGREREERILRSIQYMRNHLDESCSLEELAEVARFSPSHYSHLFKEQTNTSPIRFFIRLKMQRACELLHTTNQTVAAIGQQVGYSDPFHFSRMFKKIIGKSPSEYRETSPSS